LGPTPSQVSSLSAPTSPDVTNRVPALPRSVPRFSQPLDRTYAVNDLRVYSTPLALLGSWPSESYHVIDRAPSLVTSAPASSSVLYGVLLLQSGSSSHLTAPVLPGATFPARAPDRRNGWFPS
jgi:hypothetical protein